VFFLSVVVIIVEFVADRNLALRRQRDHISAAVQTQKMAYDDNVFVLRSCVFDRPVYGD